MFLLFCLLLANGCADLHTSKRSLHRHANRMFAGYGTWSRSFDSICLLGLEEVRKNGDVVVLKSWEDDSPPVFAFHPPTNGRIVALYDMPHHLEPTHWPPPEILFVDSDWKTCTLLYRGEGLTAFLLTDDSLRPFTWTEFHPYGKPVLFDKPIQPRTWTPVPFNSETPP